jgi:hypothetical protein
LGAAEQDHCGNEHPTLFHLIKTWKKQLSCHIGTISNGEGNMCSTPAEKLQAFVTHLRHKLTTVNVNPNAIQDLLMEVTVCMARDTQLYFHRPITEDELLVAVRNGKMNKAPGIDGIPTDFYRLAWSFIKDDLLLILNGMYINQELLSSQTQGIIVYIPKHSRPTTISDYRMITLLNADVRLYARILAARTLFIGGVTPQSIWRSGRGYHVRCISCDTRHNC